MDDAIFVKAHQHSVIPPDKMRGMATVIELSNLPSEGVVIEIGVWKGGGAYVLSKALPNRPIYLFDTFEGIPYYDVAKDNTHKTVW